MKLSKVFTTFHKDFILEYIDRKSMGQDLVQVGKEDFKSYVVLIDNLRKIVIILAGSVMADIIIRLFFSE